MVGGQHGNAVLLLTDQVVQFLRLPPPHQIAGFPQKDQDAK